MKNYETIEKIVSLLGETGISPTKLEVAECMKNAFCELSEKQKAEAFDIAMGEIEDNDDSIYIGANAYAAAAIAVVQDDNYKRIKEYKALIHKTFRKKFYEIINHSKLKKL